MRKMISGSSGILHQWIENGNDDQSVVTHRATRPMKHYCYLIA